MSKTAILNSIEDHVDVIEMSVNTLIDLCLKPAELTRERVDILYPIVEKHLLGIEADCKKFELKIQEWKNPGFLSKAKNVFKDQGKLDNARREATKKFEEVKKTVTELEQKYQDFKKIAAIFLL